MKKRFFITATGTDVGKTYVTLDLLRLFSKRGYRVGAFKPIETGVVTQPLDGTRLYECVRMLNPDCHDTTIDHIVPYQFPLPAAPAVAKGETSIEAEKLLKALAYWEERCDIVLIEGAGGIMTPIDPTTTMIDWCTFFDAYPLLITAGGLGSLSDTLVAMELFKNRNIPFSWCVNPRDQAIFEQINAPYLHSKFPRVIIYDIHKEQLADEMIERGLR